MKTFDFLSVSLRVLSSTNIYHKFVLDVVLSLRYTKAKLSITRCTTEEKDGVLQLNTQITYLVTHKIVSIELWLN